MRLFLSLSVSFSHLGQFKVCVLVDQLPSLVYREEVITEKVSQHRVVAYDFRPLKYRVVLPNLILWG